MNLSGRIFFCLAAACAFLLSSTALSQEPKAQVKFAPLKLENLMPADGKLWDVKSENFLTDDLKPVFKWLSDKKDALRAPGYKDSPAMSIFDFRICEAIVNFNKEGLVKDIDVSIYNRGDAGEVEKGRFEKALEEIQKRLTTFAGSEPGPERKETINAKNIRTKVWVKEPYYQMTLKWSASDERNQNTFRGEYIQLEITKFDSENDPRKKSIHAKADKIQLADKDTLLKNVKRPENGDVFIDDIPMVDQGPKGYCAVASAERVLRYYGLSVDQHVLAQLVDTSEAGTKPDAMIKALKSVSMKYKVNYKGLYTEKNFENQNSISKFVTLYNSVANKEKKKPVDLNNYRHQVGNTIYMNDVKLVMDLDPDIFVKCRAEKEPTDFKRFVYDIKENVDNGIPVLWALTLGIVPEPNLPQRLGGHLRLIIGYNEKTKEIIYTDSWGAGHEFKKMSYDKAWAVTRITAILQPSRKSK